MDLVTRATSSQLADVHLPVGKLIMQNLVLMFLPILLGMFIRLKRPKTADWLDRGLSKIAFPCLILLATIFFIQHRETIVREFPRLGLCISLLILLAMGGGWALARGARLTGKEIRTLNIEIGMQNAAQAIAIASSPFVFNNDIIAIPAIIYALMMNVILILYVVIVNKRLKSQPDRA